MFSYCGYEKIVGKVVAGEQYENIIEPWQERSGIVGLREQLSIKGLRGSCHSVATQTSIRLFFRGDESCLGISDIWHAFIDPLYDCLGRSGDLLLEQILFRTFHKTSLDAQPAIRQVFSTAITNFLVPDSSSAFFMVSCNDHRTFGGGICTNAALGVVSLTKPQSKNKNQSALAK
jgi:hypothetical protein